GHHERTSDERREKAEQPARGGKPVASDEWLVASETTVPANSVESYKASVGGDGLRILEQLPQIIERGAESLTPAEKELLKWVGVFYRRPTPGKFMMRIRMPNGFTRAEQLRAIAELSRRLGNGVVDITTRQQREPRGFLQRKRAALVSTCLSAERWAREVLPLLRR